MWLLHMQQTDGVRIMHGRNGRDDSLPEFASFSVNGYCPETRTFYEFLVAIFTALRVSRSVTSPPWVSLR